MTKYEAIVRQVENYLRQRENQGVDVNRENARHTVAAMFRAQQFRHRRLVRKSGHR